MTQWNQRDSGVIRITHEDAQSQHVEDLLKRQASLRGEQGITRDRGRSWYYQNWFVFSICGMLAAAAAWALLEPHFQDRTYIQGRVLRVGGISTSAETEESVVGGSSGRVLRMRELSVGNGNDREFNTIVIFDKTRCNDPAAKYPLLPLDQLKEGDRAGFYAQEIPGFRDLGSGKRFAAEYVDLHAVGEYDTTREDIEAQEWRSRLVNLFYFSIMAGAVGLFIGAADGLVCRLGRRMLIAGGVGLLSGVIGGFISSLLANMIYGPLTLFAAKHPGAMGFALQTAGRGLAWCLAGMTMGLGQGIALRSKRLLIYGLLGGLVGGLFGGLLFDPITELRGNHGPTGWLSRLVGVVVVGGVVGLMIGIVERLARDAWLRMVEGPLAGKEFLLFKDVMRLGSSPRAELYLFNDPDVTPQHAILRTTGDTYELENTCRENPVCINGRPITRSRLRHGDRISLGRTAFVFQRQKGE